MSATVNLAKWKIICATVVALAAPPLAVWADRASADTRAAPLTEGQIRGIFKEEIGPLRSQLAALETRTTLNEAELATYRARLIPRLDQMGDRLTTIAETVARLDERSRKQ